MTSLVSCMTSILYELGEVQDHVLNVMIKANVFVTFMIPLSHTGADFHRCDIIVLMKGSHVRIHSGSGSSHFEAGL